jgi:uncharacterized surface protein with fasciclin (FAS1) repeats
MRTKRFLTGGAALMAATALAATVVTGSTAQATTASAAKVGTTSLATVLTSDGNTFDRNSKDFDILTQAVLAVLAAKPNSPVKVLTQGNVRLTAFAPNDAAFEKLASALTGTKVTRERAAFNAVAGLGINKVERVLLYHVVAGATITSKQALAANGAKLVTAAGPKLTVVVKGAGTKHATVWIKDANKSTTLAKVIVPDINKGNKQIAHGINAVLLPAKV